MSRHRHPPLIDERVDARRPISTDLLAAAAGAPPALAERYRSAWFETAEDITNPGAVLVFDEFVVGRADPLLLEAVHQLRLMRRAERLGVFDDEGAEWYDTYPDDDAVYEHPTLPERALSALADGQGAQRLIHGSAVATMVAKVLRPERDMYMTVIRLELTLERLLAELADAIRVGNCAVVDARLPGERADGWWWAA